MKSEISYQNVDIPVNVLETLLGVVQEWEDFTGKSSVFTIGATTSGLMGGVKRQMFFLCNPSEEEGVLLSTLTITEWAVPCEYVLGDRYVKALWVEGDQIQIQSDIYKTSWTSLEDLSDWVGVGDFTNIQPHEYGLLKLKFGVDKDSLFIPSIVVKELKKGLL